VSVVDSCDIRRFNRLEFGLPELHRLHLDLLLKRLLRAVLPKESRSQGLIEQASLLELGLTLDFEQFSVRLKLSSHIRINGHLLLFLLWRGHG